MLGIAFAAACARTFCNPLNLDYRFELSEPSRREAADPTMVVAFDAYWLFASKSGGYWHSSDLVDWELVAPTGLPLEDYAPTVLVLNGTMYFTAFGSRAVYATRDPLGGAWERVADLEAYGDPALFLDDVDGRVYVAFGCSDSEATHIVQLDPANGWKEVGARLPVARGNGTLHGWENPGDDNELTGEAPWIEGSWITKAHGRYYLQYAGPGTQFKSYGDGVLTSASIAGPFTRDAGSPFSHNPSGFAAGSGHGSTFQDLRGRWWHVGTTTISVRHKFERRLALFPVSFIDAPAGGGSAAPPERLMRMNATLGCYPRSVETSLLAPWQLLSYRKPALASSTLAETFAPAQAFDEDIRTWWAARSGAAGEWLRVDLGAISTVHALQLNFAEQNATALGRLPASDACRYYVESSTDGLRWAVILDRRPPAVVRDAPHDYHELPAAAGVRARYVRVTSAHVPANAVFSLSGLRVFGTGAPSLEPPPVVEGVAVARDGADRRQAAVSWAAARGARMYVVRYGERATASSEAHLFHAFQVDGGRTSVTLRALSIGVEYAFTVDAVNEAGRTVGSRLVLG